MQVTLAGKVAVVTGAASGIGLATVLRYLEAGAAGVVAVDMTPAPPEPLAAHVGGRLRYVAGDVGDEATADVTALFLAARHVVPVMPRQRAGVILNTGSISGQSASRDKGSTGRPRGPSTSSPARWPSRLSAGIHRPLAKTREDRRWT